jgi:DNA-binding CsgD family transcriptional regulator
MARPKATIDWAKVDRMLEAGCSGLEVAATLGIHPDTLYMACQRDHKTGFSDYSAIKRASGDRLLKVKQFEVAMTGDKTMLVWLGKQRLGQSEKSEVKNDHTTAGDKINIPPIHWVTFKYEDTGDED